MCHEEEKTRKRHTIFTINFFLVPKAFRQKLKYILNIPYYTYRLYNLKNYPLEHGMHFWDTKTAINVEFSLKLIHILVFLKESLG